MAPPRRNVRRILKAFLPILLPVVLVFVGALGWLVYAITHPRRSPYIVTPEKFSQLSARGLKATEETWQNRDGTRARGWLLRGAEGAPAVVLLHAYGDDRSYLLNLGVKLNEATNYTVLWPDLRGHGENPPVSYTSFGLREGEDVLAALDYLRSLKSPQGRPLVGERLGIYGVEMGAYAGLSAAPQAKDVHALVLDSVPASPDELLNMAATERVGMDNNVVRWLARMGTRIYFLGNYENTPACARAASLGDRRLLLLTGKTAGALHTSTVALGSCFPQTSNLEMQSDLSPFGLNIQTATGEQSETYDRRVINFFDQALRAAL
jgi:pimeloyl-ACP methyl ester carboxylesterase